MEWEHGVRNNHILVLRTTVAHEVQPDETIVVNKDGRRVYADGPILFCDKSWWMVGYCQVIEQRISTVSPGQSQTQVTVKILTNLNQATARLLSRENAKAQKAAGNLMASPEKF